MQPMHNVHQQKRHNGSSNSLHNLYSYENEASQYPASPHMSHQSQQAAASQAAPRGYAPHPYSTTPTKQSQQMTSRSAPRNNHNYYTQPPMSSSFDGASNLPKMSAVNSLQSLSKQSSMPSPISSHRSQRAPHHTQSPPRSSSQTQPLRPSHNKHSMTQYPPHAPSQPAHGHPSPSPSRYHVASPRSAHHTQPAPQPQPQSQSQSISNAASASSQSYNHYASPHPGTATANSNHLPHSHSHPHPHSHAYHAPPPGGYSQHHPSSSSASQHLYHHGHSHQAASHRTQPAALPPQRNDPSLFTLEGILRVMKQHDANYGMVTLGMDLTQLGGLDLNCNEPEINHTFLSPWVEKWDDSAKFATPNDYKLSKNGNNHDHPPTKFIARYKDATLLYIFYSMVNDKMQMYAANELYQRNWIYHKGLQLWLHKIPSQQSVSNGKKKKLAANAQDEKDNNSHKDKQVSASKEEKEKTTTEKEEERVSEQESNDEANAKEKNHKSEENEDEQKVSNDEKSNAKCKHSANGKDSTEQIEGDDEHKVDASHQAESDAQKANSHDDKSSNSNGMSTKREDKAVTFVKNVSVDEIEYFDVTSWKTRHFHSEFPVDWSQEKKRVLSETQMKMMFKECQEFGTKSGRGH